MNLFLFDGRIGKDAQVSQTQGGAAKASFSVAVKSGFGDKEKTSWIHCSVFGKRAEGGLIQYLKKGQQVLISGEFTHQEWQDQQGNQRSMPAVVVDKIDLIGGRNDNQGQQQANYQQQPTQVMYKHKDENGDEFSDSIPF